MGTSMGTGVGTRAEVGASFHLVGGQPERRLFPGGVGDGAERVLWTHTDACTRVQSSITHRANCPGVNARLNKPWHTRAVEHGPALERREAPAPAVTWGWAFRT